MRVVWTCGGQRVQGDGGRSRGEMDLTVGVIASQTQAGGSPERKRAGHGAWTVLMWEVKVAGGRPWGGSREQLTVHPHRQGCVRAEVSQEFVWRCEALVARPSGWDPVASVWQGIVGEHEAIRVEGMREGGGCTGWQGALVERVEGVGGIHQWEAGFEGGGRVVDAGVAVASTKMGYTWVT